MALAPDKPAVDLQGIVEIRHDLHAHPELAYTEQRTSGVVQRELKSLGIEFKDGLAGGTGVLGWLPATSNAPDKAETIALRADMDALPILEESGKPYASTNPGLMHACGHDGHTSILLGAAKALAQTPERPNNVLLLFQPAEEGGAGGKRMVEDGALNGKAIGRPVDMIFGLHGWTTLGLGKLATRPGPMMAATNTFTITIRGKGGHAAAPHTTCDPIVAAAHLVTALQSIASRNVSPFEQIVVTVGQLQGGTAANIIPEFATLKGTVRTLTPEIRKLAEKRVKEAAKGVAEAFGAAAETEWLEGYPSTANDPDAVERFLRVATGIWGEERVSGEGEPTMGGEDFAYYGLEVPSCFYQLGLIPHGQDSYPSVHTPRFDFNDEAIPIGVRTMVGLALS